MFEVKMKPSADGVGVDCELSASNISQDDLVAYIGIMIRRLYDTVFETNQTAAKMLRFSLLAMLAEKSFWKDELAGEVLTRDCVMYSGPTKNE